MCPCAGLPSSVREAFIMKSCKGFFLCILAFSGLVFLGLLAQAQAPSLAASPQVFVFVQRSSSHIRFSKSEVFHNVLDDLTSYFNQKNVVMAVDQFGGRTNSEEDMSLSTVQSIARDAGATYLLYALVERPVTKWIKVTVSCYDMSGRKLWAEEASSGGGMSGGHGLEVTLGRLHEKLDKRIGQRGLPVQVAAQ